MPHPLLPCVHSMFVVSGGQLAGADLESTLHIWRMHVVQSGALEAVGWPNLLTLPWQAGGV